MYPCCVLRFWPSVMLIAQNRTLKEKECHQCNSHCGHLEGISNGMRQIGLINWFNLAPEIKFLTSEGQEGQ